MSVCRASLVVGSLLTAGLAGAQAPEDLYGGWVFDRDGERHIYYIVLRNDGVSGTYCYDCEDPYKLAFIDDGILDEDGLRFSVYHYPRNADAYVEQVVAELVDAQLQLSITGPAGEHRTQTVRRISPDERVLLPMPDSTPNTQTGPGLTGQPRVLPSEPQVITVELVEGLWLWGTGPGKQHFIFRPHKDGVRGMVCGPCDSAWDVAPLEGITMEGTNFHFEIVHEDNGAAARVGPYSNVTNAQVSSHEMHMSVVPSYEGPDFSPIEMTLLGPVAVD